MQHGIVLTAGDARTSVELAVEAEVGLVAQDDAGFGTVGEPTGARERAAILDELLAVVDGLRHEEPFAFSGKHFAFEANVVGGGGLDWNLGGRAARADRGWAARD